MKKSCRFIQAEDKIFVPSLTIWLAGWARQRWLEGYFVDKQIINLGAESWSDMCLKKGGYQILAENNDGKYEVVQ